MSAHVGLDLLAEGHAAIDHGQYDPMICSLGLSRFLTRSTVLDKAPMPSRARNSACSGTKTASAPTRAFKVTRPRDGGNRSEWSSKRPGLAFPPRSDLGKPMLGARRRSARSRRRPATPTPASLTGWDLGRSDAGIEGGQAEQEFIGSG